MKKILLLVSILLIFSTMSLTVFSQNVVAATGDCGKSKTFFGLPTWYKYLDMSPSPDCSVQVTEKVVTAQTDSKGNVTYAVKNSFTFAVFFKILFAVIEILLVLAGILAVIMAIAGGFKYVVSQGEPEKIGNAKMTIINALIGATIAIIASQVVAFIGAAFVGGGSDQYGLIHFEADTSNLQRGLDVFFAIIGAVSVFMVVFAGFNFVTSGGDSEKVKKARRTIYYAVVGIVVAIFASVIVNFVLGRVT
jgi:hypothetical protein